MFQLKISNVPLKTLVERGQALIDMCVVDTWEDEFGRSMCRIATCDGKDLPDHEFGPGDNVLVRPYGTWQDNNEGQLPSGKEAAARQLLGYEEEASAYGLGIGLGGTADVLGVLDPDMAAAGPLVAAARAGGEGYRAEVFDLNSKGMRLQLMDHDRDGGEDEEGDDGGDGSAGWDDPLYDTDDEEDEGPEGFGRLRKGTKVRVDLSYNAVAFDRMEEALGKMAETCNSREVTDGILDNEPESLASRRPEATGLDTLGSSLASAATALRDALGGAGQSAFDAGAAVNLNATQREAVSQAMERRLTLIQGPPGTGKTSTAVQLIAAFVRRRGVASGAFGVRSRILAVAQSNVAVDNLAEGLVGLGLKVVRIGSPGRIRACLAACTLDAHMARHPSAARLQQLRQQLKADQQSRRELRSRGQPVPHKIQSRIEQNWRDVEGLEEAMLIDIVEGADVVCATCVASGGRELRGFTFQVVVLDEGSQCSEPEALIPLTKGARQAVLVGDQKQLPPVVQSRRAAEGGMAVSLFERLSTLGVCSHLLGVQYRMHPGIAAFPNTRFYDGRLVDGVLPASRMPPALPGLREDVPIHLVSREEMRADTGSKSNPRQARLAASIVRHLLSDGALLQEDIGVVSPYAAQVDALARVLRQAGVEVARGAYAVQQGGKAVEVKSVDGYQGREKPVILVSTVRSNQAGNVGFLADARRLNVAITRPQRALIIVGDANTLGHDPTWSAYLRWLRERGCVVDEPAFLRMLPGGVSGGRELLPRGTAKRPRRR